MSLCLVKHPGREIHCKDQRSPIAFLDLARHPPRAGAQINHHRGREVERLQARKKLLSHARLQHRGRFVRRTRAIERCSYFFSMNAERRAIDRSHRVLISAHDDAHFRLRAAPRLPSLLLSSRLPSMRHRPPWPRLLLSWPRPRRRASGSSPRLSRRAAWLPHLLPQRRTGYWQPSRRLRREGSPSLMPRTPWYATRTAHEPRDETRHSDGREAPPQAHATRPAT